MKTCRIDKLGRIVIPIQYRKKLGLCEGSELNIEYEGRRVIVTPAEELCRICGGKLCDCREIAICKGCIEKVKRMK